MTHTYHISGMTCSGCQAKVKALLEKIPDVTTVHIDLEKATAAITMDRHIATAGLQAALKDYPKYQLEEPSPIPDAAAQAEEAPASWLRTYKPILLVFGYILLLTGGLEISKGGVDGERWMNNFMAAFFLVFSFFKMLDLRGFAESYFSYDIIARKWMPWGYVYAFAELALGIAYLFRLAPLLTNTITFILMSLSIIGVLQSVLNKRKIKCACLGAVFNLPMSTITIIEDALMILMSAFMVLRML